MILQFLLAMTAAASFAVLFGVPKEQFFFSSFSGGVGWISYLLFCRLSIGEVFASLFAAFFLTILSRLFASIRKNPATLYLVTGIFTLVPGAGIYYASYYFIMNDMRMFAAKSVETFQIAGAISIGILFGFAIPQKVFYTKKAR
ncbi:MAG: threonine/serine exporter [Eubacterium sp.]|jgi:uncharacterized membrane protein YjjB (DUF3815 family)|nr:threonine/serine exporter [Eubacterium sp.]